MSYAKLENGTLVYAPNGIEIDNIWYIPPSEQQLKDLGYKEIEYTNPPEYKENYVNIQSWEETTNKIKQVWTQEHVEPPEPQYTVEERLAVLEEMLMEMMEE